MSVRTLVTWRFAWDCKISFQDGSLWYGCWLEASVSSLIDLQTEHSHWAVECSHGKTAAFSQSKSFKGKSKGKLQRPLWPSLGSYTPSHPPHFGVITYNLLSRGGELGTTFLSEEWQRICGYLLKPPHRQIHFPQINIRYTWWPTADLLKEMDKEWGCWIFFKHK